MSHIFEFVIASITIFVFIVVAIIILAVIINLIYKTIEEWRTNKNKEKNQLIHLLITTIVGIVSFELSIIIIVTVMIEVFLVDDYFHPYHHTVISNNSLSSTYDTFLYLIAVFHALGHLSMLIVFITRFQYTFANSVFYQSRNIIIFMYIMLIVVTIASFIILMFDFFVLSSNLSHSQLLIWEIIWEFCVECTILLILFLFVSNLYKLLKLSFISHMRKGTKQDLISQITASNSESKSKTHSAWTMTIDGISVHPIWSTAVQSVNKSQSAAANKSISTVHKSESVTENNIAQQDEKNKVNKAKHYSSNTSTAADVIIVMNKIALLVIIAAGISFVTISGNFIIDFHGAFNDKDIAMNNGLNYNAIWVFILPVLDMFVTSFTLYLQFKFAHRVYHRMCNCLDGMFLKCMLFVVTYNWSGETGIDDKGKEQKQQSVELQTKSTVTSDEIAMDSQHQSDHVQIEMQTVIR